MLGLWGMIVACVLVVLCCPGILAAQKLPRANSRKPTDKEGLEMQVYTNTKEFFQRTGNFLRFMFRRNRKERDRHRITQEKARKSELRKTLKELNLKVRVTKCPRGFRVTARNDKGQSVHVGEAKTEIQVLEDTVQAFHQYQNAEDVIREVSPAW